ncbi:MAG TPA: hypothetical protein VGR28_10700 [Candidatus Thermoplasmatota archaeon]|nr:hypothetical protein [Candidatus Thermoplasmatota archaeon]
MHVAVIGFVLLSLSIPGGDGVSVSTTYVGGNGLAIACLLPQPVQVDLAGACFLDLPLGAAHVRIEIDDVTALPVGARFNFLDADGNTLARDEFCDHAEADVPEGASSLLVFLGGVFAYSCGPGPLDGQAVAGTVAASFA